MGSPATNLRRDTAGRFAPGPPSPESEHQLGGAIAEVEALRPKNVEPLVLEDRNSMSVSADLLRHLKENGHLDRHAHWQDALNHMSRATPERSGQVLMDVNDPCYNCGGLRYDPRMGGECPDCSGTGSMLIERVVEVRYAPRVT